MKRHLAVPYCDKDEVKRLGAQWDTEVKRWWIPESRDTGQFLKWIPVQTGRFLEEKKEDLPIKDRNSPDYARFRQWWDWWNTNLPANDHKDQIGSFRRVGSIVAEKQHKD